MTDRNEDIIALLRFYSEECNPEEILKIPIPSHSLQIEEEHFKYILAFSPLFIKEEKLLILEQLPFMTQDEFEEIFDEILTAHSQLKEKIAHFIGNTDALAFEFSETIEMLKKLK